MGSSVAELLPALNKRVPGLIVVGNDQADLAGELGAVAAFDSFFPGVPLIAIGRHRPSLGADAIIDHPVDALELLALVRLFQSEGASA